MRNPFNNKPINNVDNQRSLSAWLWKVKGALALGLMLVVLPACEANNEPTATVPETETVTEPATEVPPAPGTGTAQTGVEVEDVAEDPNQYLGQTVTVTGEVEEVLGPNTFRIQENELFGGDEVLVVTPDPTVPIAEDNQVQITGDVRTMVLAEFEREYNLTWDANVRQQIEAEYENRPVIVARTVAATPAVP